MRMSVCWNSSSHRSEPMGLRAAALRCRSCAGLARRRRVRRRLPLPRAVAGSSLVLDGGGGHDISSTISPSPSSVTALYVGVGQPRLHVGGAAVGGEDVALALRAQLLRAGKLIEHRTVDEEVRSVLLDRDRRGLGLGSLEDRALGDARADHQGSEHECRHGPHETHEFTPLPDPRQSTRTLDSTFQPSESAPGRRPGGAIPGLERHQCVS